MTENIPFVNMFFEWCFFSHCVCIPWWMHSFFWEVNISMAFEIQMMLMLTWYAFTMSNDKNNLYLTMFDTSMQYQVHMNPLESRSLFLWNSISIVRCFLHIVQGHCECVPALALVFFYLQPNKISKIIVHTSSCQKAWNILADQNLGLPLVLIGHIGHVRLHPLIGLEYL